ncbi:MAG: PAS domain S-box protein [Sulfurospirillaceae bacterium]|nr:PAS domain S-box protein [Sulfurospirillaceae bacterium]
MLEKRTFDFVLVDDIYYKVDNSGRILYVSSSVKRVLGYDKEELIGLHLHELYVNPQNRAQNYKELDTSISNFTIEDLLKHKDGSHVFMSTNAHFVKDKAGNIIGIEGISRDITREYELKKRLSHNEKTYKAIFENSPSGIIYHDSKGVIIEANKAALNIFGVTKEQFIGFDLLRETSNEELKQAIDKSLKGGKSHFKGLYVSILAKKRMYLEVSFQAIKDEDENVIFIVASVDDQTATEKALKKLRKSKEDWKSIIDNMQNIFLQTDKDGNIIKVSPSVKDVAGYEMDEILGKMYLLCGLLQMTYNISENNI